jgi:4-diphosphocytidyl-2-C-methyl-D-erythritol kinase
MRFYRGLREGMQLFAPAKINLSLKILGRRDDGFHEIDTLMSPISLRDELTIDPGDGGISFSCDDPGLPSGEGNLVVKAARRFFAELRREPRVRIRLAKKIPHGAGLGGGSSDAASTLLGLNEMHGKALAPSRLRSLAAEIGSDVPFFLGKGPARCRGRGEIVEPVPALPRLPLLLLKPEFGVPSPWAYQHWRDSRELPGIEYSPQRVGELVLENDLERPVFEKYIFLAQAKTWLKRQAGMAGALLSGSGSTLFAVMGDERGAEEVARRAKEELDPRLWVCVCETVGGESRQAGC